MGWYLWLLCGNHHGMKIHVLFKMINVLMIRSRIDFRDCHIDLSTGCSESEHTDLFVVTEHVKFSTVIAHRERYKLHGKIYGLPYMYMW